MATVNRYTQYQPTRYNPRSLQEMMMAPQYMRTRHDAADQGLAELRALSANIYNDPIHDELVGKELDRIDTMIGEQAELLASEGFNNSRTRSLLNLSSDFQSSVGPRGILGKAMAWKDQREAEDAKANQIALQMNYSQDIFDKQRALAYEEAKRRFEETGEITPYEAPSAPEFLDLQDSIDDAIKMMGPEVLQHIQNNGYGIDVVADPAGNPIIGLVNKSGVLIKEGTDNKVNDAINYLNNVWFNESGKGYRSNTWQGMDPNYIAEQINLGMNIGKSNRLSDSRNNSFQVLSHPYSSKDGKEETPDIPTTFGARNETSISIDNYFRGNGVKLPKDHSKRFEKLKEIVNNEDGEYSRAMVTAANAYINQLNSVMDKFEASPEYLNLDDNLKDINRKGYTSFYDYFNNELRDDGSRMTILLEGRMNNLKTDPNLEDASEDYLFNEALKSIRGESIRWRSPASKDVLDAFNSFNRDMEKINKAKNKYLGNKYDSQGFEIVSYVENMDPSDYRRTEELFRQAMTNDSDQTVIAMTDRKGNYENVSDYNVRKVIGDAVINRGVKNLSVRYGHMEGTGLFGIVANAEIDSEKIGLKGRNAVERSVKIFYPIENMLHDPENNVLSSDMLMTDNIENPDLARFIISGVDSQQAIQPTSDIITAYSSLGVDAQEVTPSNNHERFGYRSVFNDDGREMYSVPVLMNAFADDTGQNIAVEVDILMWNDIGSKIHAKMDSFGTNINELKNWIDTFEIDDIINFNIKSHSINTSDFIQGLESLKSGTNDIRVLGNNQRYQLQRLLYDLNYN